MERRQNYKIAESYRNQAYFGIIRLDLYTNLWAWKGTIDFDTGPHSLFTNRTFSTAAQAEDHMRQFARQCIDNRLG